MATSPAYTARVVPDGSLVVAGLRVETVLANGKKPALHLEDDGSVLLDRGVAVETLRPTEAGVSQSWLFREVIVEHDLVVRVRVSGMEWETDTPSGHLFLDPRSGRRARYGEALWIDRRGRKTKLRTEHETGGLAIVVPRDLLAASELPAVLDPVIGPELPVGGLDGETLAPIAPGSHVAVTAGGPASFLVTWTDKRPGLAGERRAGGRGSRLGSARPERQWTLGSSSRGTIRPLPSIHRRSHGSSPARTGTTRGSRPPA